MGARLGQCPLLLGQVPGRENRQKHKSGTKVIDHIFEE
jgi:hypothetical protein